MSFKESVIIPYTMFKRCQFGTTPQKQEHETILQDPSLPSDIKMKLYSQAKATNTAKSLQENDHSSTKTNQDHDHAYIVQVMPEKDQPFASSILSKIDSREDEISWNNKLELLIDGKQYPESNIIELLRFVLKNLIVSSDMDIPKAAKEFVDKLQEIGVPKSWIKVSFPRRAPKRTKVKHSQRKNPPLDDSEEDLPAKTQKGKGLSWIMY